MDKVNASIESSMVQSKRNSFVPLAFTLMFVPFVLLIILITVFSSENPPAILPVLGCMISVSCGVISSAIFFHYRTPWAVFFGVASVLLNSVCALYFGLLTLLCAFWIC
jgi:hypothetical protein